MCLKAVDHPYSATLIGFCLGYDVGSLLDPCDHCLHQPEDPFLHPTALTIPRQGKGASSKDRG